ncbi:MAG: tagatose 1,6-diphosphate aldolase [Rhizobiaceae bacterium]|nr:MAG: tagatose 1,6-diphosphate aldolase [Rhizobiaceae bacterium]
MTTIGKTRGLARLVNDSGHFTMVALDQRPPLFAAIAKARGIAPGEVTFQDMLKAKRLLVEALAEDASSMLFDPNFAVPAAIDVLPRKTGLIMTLEDHRVEETPEGRKSRAIDNWSVGKIRQIGADGVKVLAWYRPDAGNGVKEHQKAFVRSVGEDCRRHDIPFILELLVYPFAGSEKHTADYVESPDKRADLVVGSVREFARPEYGVDLFKLETPLPSASLPAPDNSAAAREVARQFEAIGAICREAGVPWVMLSGGAAPDQFERVLSYSYAAGAQGFLAGRTIWLNAVESGFPDGDKVLNALREDGRKRLARLNELTAREAKPWKPVYGRSMATAEGDFAGSYGFPA